MRASEEMREETRGRGRGRRKREEGRKGGEEGRRRREEEKGGLRAARTMVRGGPMLLLLMMMLCWSSESITKDRVRWGTDNGLIRFANAEADGEGESEEADDLRENMKALGLEDMSEATMSQLFQWAIGATTNRNDLDISAFLMRSNITKNPKSIGLTSCCIIQILPWLLCI